MTMLARITPSVSSGFDIRTFECPACGQLLQRVIELDPMKSLETMGWLQGELQMPM